MRALVIAIVVLLSPMMALAQAAPPPGPSLAETAPMPEPHAAELSFRHVAAISVGAVAGVIAINIATGGMILPVLAAGLVETAPAAPATAAAVVPAVAMGGVDYLATVSETAVLAVGAIVGGYVGNWLYGH
jgi:uncharacterized membrane protein YfcA